MKYPYLLPLFLFSLLISLAGCGNDNSLSQTASNFAASETCIKCHKTERAISSVTGASINDEWASSAHNSMHGASCIDCHGSGNGHPSSCGGCHGGSTTVGLEFHNPEKASMCYKCHGLNHPEDIMVSLAPQHFGNMTASINNNSYRASYVSSQYVGNCRKCHNPHDPSGYIAINRQWAGSGHGNTLSGARTRYDFKTRGSYEPVNRTFQFYCERCHTTTGYIKFVSSGFSDIAPFAGPGYEVVQNMPLPVVPAPADKPSPDKSKEVTGCNACHDDGKGNAYNFKMLRNVAPVRIYYNISTAWTSPTVRLNNSPVDYPDKGASNMCVPCHAGRGAGQLIKSAAAAGLDFTSAPSSISAHDRDVAATLAKHGGYEFDGRDYANPDEYLHEKIGMNNIQGTGTRGPCITCHMRSNESHSFQPVRIDSVTGAITDIISRTCANCHNNALKPAWTPQALQAKRAGLQAALAALSRLRTVKGVPKAVSTPNPKGLYNWEFQFGVGSGPNTMGANFNYSFLVNEWGAFAHNSTYVKRLIYDSIDWLNDGALNNDVEAAINGLTYVAGAKNPVTGIVYTAQELADLNATAINYLIGGPGGQRP